MIQSYNPSKHIENAAAELLRQPPQPLAPLASKLVGVYLMSYLGPNPLYDDIRGEDKFIYVGKGEAGLGTRLTKHHRSICDVHQFDPNDLDPADFVVRMLALPKYYCAGVEQYLLDKYAIRWNQPEFFGFGTNGTKNRSTSKKKCPPWDVLHPGRPFAFAFTRPNSKDAEFQKKLAAFNTRNRSYTITDLLGEF